MKITILFVLVAVMFLAYAQAQQCPRNPECNHPRNEGHGGRNCRGSTKWYYNTRERRCRPMDYKGCGGNLNRYCSLADCRRRCGGS